MNWVALSSSGVVGDDRSRWSLGVVQHPWGPMVGIPTPPKRGCVQ
jgi:hypothetical protein